MGAQSRTMHCPLQDLGLSRAESVLQGFCRTAGHLGVMR